ncbi:MAG: glycosyltransferase [Candidatus Cloacimonas sp.]|jgi:glycosyltransferase involved in cell wall biosynthesis|nr:glycosyltransferase [Candidatus Cloacimonas sp.]
MKICIVSNSHATNDVRLYYKLARSLAKKHEVWLITSNGVENKTQNPYQMVVNTDSHWWAIWQILAKVKRIKPDLLICVEPLTLLIGKFLKKPLKLKVIFDIHEFYADAFSERVPLLLRYLAKQCYLNLLKRLQRGADGVFAVNQEILNQTIGSNADSWALVLPNYPVKNVWDYECNIPGALAQLCDMHFDLIYIGGLTVNRGVLKILKMATLLKLEFPALKILILGKFFDPQVEKEFTDSINSYNLNAVIYYQEWIPAEKIGLLLKRSRFGLWFFNPKIDRLRLSTPLKVLEYLAAGLPVITVKTELMKALVEYNHLGVCSGYQSNKLAEATAKMLRLSDAEYENMSARCLKLTESKFNWEAMEPQLFAAIDRASAK